MAMPVRSKPSIPEATPPRPLMSPRHVAAFLRTNSRGIDRMVIEGIIPAPIVFGPRMRRWCPAALDAALAALAGQQGGK